MALGLELMHWCIMAQVSSVQMCILLMEMEIASSGPSLTCCLGQKQNMML